MRLPRSSPLRLTFLLAATAAAALALLACSSPAESTPTEGSSSPDATQPAGSASPTTSEAATGEGRPFAMGFTPYPHDGALPGLQDALAIIEDEGDLAAMHFDGGVPWLEALSGDPWPDPYRAEVEGKAGAIPGGHLVYLAVTPISFERDALAPYAGPGGVGPLPPPWDGYAFNSPEVIEAYGNFVLRMVDLYHPDYLAYAIEPNLFADNRPDQWPALVDLAAATYATVKQAHPDLPTFVSIQAEWFHRAPATQAALIADLLPYTDLIAVSAYPYIDGLSATAMPDAYFEDLRALAPDKPFAVAETGWPAEPVGAPYPVAIPSDEAAQAAYLDWLLADAATAEAEFVTWFLPRDLDAQWQTLATLPVAPTARIFRDNGLYAGDRTERPALQRWRAVFEQPRAR